MRVLIVRTCAIMVCIFNFMSDAAVMCPSREQQVVDVLECCSTSHVLCEIM